MQLFAQLAKYDENTGYFEAVAADESLDKAGEIFDYAKSKPHFQTWSETISKASGGKSLGNVRAMHGKVAAGKLTGIDFDDDGKAIKVAGFVVDANEKAKMAQGVYTGVSIGGSYGKTWDDPVHKGVKRYEAIPSEISIVDLPCNSNAHFTVVKGDGSEELRKFEHTTENAETLEKWADGLDDDERGHLTDALLKIAERKDVSAADKKRAEEEASSFADTKNKKYKLDTAKQIKAAWSYIHMPKNASKYSAADVKAIKARIVAAWKKKIDSKGPPEAEKWFQEAGERLVKADGAERVANAISAALGNETLAKGLWDVGRFAELLASLGCIQMNAADEAVWEGDDSPVPEQMRAALKPLVDAFLAMAAEEAHEATAGKPVQRAAGDELNKSEEDAMNNELQKSLDDTKAELEKVTSTQASLRKALGCAEGEDLVEKAAALVKSLETVNAEHAELKKTHEALETEMGEIKKFAEEKSAEVEKLNGQVAKPKGAVTKVEKTTPEDDLGGDAKVDNAPVKKADGTIDQVATAEKLAKQAYKNPVRLGAR